MSDNQPSNKEYLNFMDNFVSATEHLTEKVKSQNINVDLLADKIIKEHKIAIVQGHRDKKPMINIYNGRRYEVCTDTKIKHIIRSYIPVGKATMQLINSTLDLITYSAELYPSYDYLEDKIRELKNLKNVSNVEGEEECK